MDPSTFALADPITIGGVTLRNRIVMAPVESNYADEAGRVTDKTLGFYEERGRGGAAALIFEPLAVSPHVKSARGQHEVWNDAFVPGLAEVARRVHAHGALLFAQISHGGPKAVSAFNDGVQPVSASDVPVKVADAPRPMAREEISRVVEDFAAAAVRMREAGFDGVELHACHSYLLSAFLSPYLNRRTDEYGGSVENRTRLVCRVIQAVKAGAGSDFPVLCRLNGYEALPGGIDQAQAREIAGRLAEAGADAIHVSAAAVEQNPKTAALHVRAVGVVPDRRYPHGCFVEYAASVKRAVHVPVIAVGKLNDPEVAERVVRDGMADVVAIARGIIADPYLPTKMLSGRWDDIVRCDDCMVCHTTLWKQRDVDCSVNPRPWRPKGYATGRYLKGRRSSEAPTPKDRKPGSGATHCLGSGERLTRPQGPARSG